VQKSAKELEITPSQWILRWVKNQSDCIIPIVAASSLKQLETNLKAVLD